MKKSLACLLTVACMLVLAGCQLLAGSPDILTEGTEALTDTAETCVETHTETYIETYIETHTETGDETAPTTETDTEAVTGTVTETDAVTNAVTNDVTNDVTDAVTETETATQPATESDTDPVVTETAADPEEGTDPGDAPEIALDYVLSQADVDQFHELMDEFEALAVEGTDEQAVWAAYSLAYRQYQYIITQYKIANLAYYCDVTDPVAMSHYAEGESLYAHAWQIYNDSLSAIASSSSPIKDIIFKEWTPQDLLELQIDNEAVVNLENENHRLTIEALSLPYDDQWAISTNRIFLQLVANNNAIAKEYGYDNFYEYASVREYMRDYGAEDRAAFRSYVKSFVLPLYQSADQRFRELRSTVDAETWNAFVDLVQAAYRADAPTDHVKDYINTFDGDLRRHMLAMLDTPNAAVFATADGAYTGAFTAFLPYYQHPVAYFGPGYTDLLTVIHENGHFAAFFHMGDRNATLDLLETHSQGNEWLFMAYLADKIDPTVYELYFLNRLLNGYNYIILATVVDEFEEAVYTAETPYTPEALDDLMTAIALPYGCAKDAVEYYKYVVIQAPVYYLSYATSEIASMQIYALATKDYGATQQLYERLVEESGRTNGFLSVLSAAGLNSPFDPHTFGLLEEAMTLAPTPEKTEKEEPDGFLP